MYLSGVQDPQQHNSGSVSISNTIPVAQKALEYLQILCSENEESSRLSPLKSTTKHHYHAIGIVLSVPLCELFCYLGYRVTSVDIARCRHTLRSWFQQHDREARQMALHAGKLFACIRQSNLHGYYEGRAMLIACLSLWIYSDNVRSPSDLPSERTIIPTIRLDQHLGKQIEETWLQDGTCMRAYLTGVGNIMKPDGVSRLIQEASRVLCASSIWPISDAQGKALQIFHKLRTSESGQQEA